MRMGITGMPQEPAEMEHEICVQHLMLSDFLTVDEQSVLGSLFYIPCTAVQLGYSVVQLAAVELAKMRAAWLMLLLSRRE